MMPPQSSRPVGRLWVSRGAATTTGSGGLLMPDNEPVLVSGVSEPRAQYIVDEPWAKIPLSVADDDRLTRADLRVYIQLDYLGGRRGHWYGSRSIIAAALNIHPNTVALSVQTLVERGYIAVERLGIRYDNVYRYYILARTQAPPPVDDPPADTAVSTDVDSIDSTAVDSASAVRLTPTISPQNHTIEPHHRGRAVRAPTPPAGTPKLIDDAFIEEMIASFADVLGGAQRVRERIEEALNHKASDKWKNKRLGVRTWLRRDAATELERRSNGRRTTYGGDNGGARPADKASPYGTWADVAAEQEALGFGRPSRVRVSDDDDV